MPQIAGVSYPEEDFVAYCDLHGGKCLIITFHGRHGEQTMEHFRGFSSVRLADGEELIYDEPMIPAFVVNTLPKKKRN
jgi:hypothetical protein